MIRDWRRLLRRGRGSRAMFAIGWRWLSPSRSCKKIGRHHDQL
jgi:hypothetical protein